MNGDRRERWSVLRFVSYHVKLCTTWATPLRCKTEALAIVYTPLK